MLDLESYSPQLAVGGAVKFRIVAKVPEGLMRLATVRRPRTNYVVVAPTVGADLERSGRLFPICDEHISAYLNPPVAPNLLGNMHVHHTFNLNDPGVRKIDFASVVLAKNGYCGVPYLSQAVLRPTRKSLLSEKQAKEPLVELTSYDPSRNTLILNWSFVTKRFLPPWPLDQGINVASFNHGEVVVLLHWTFINLPSSPMGARVMMVTSPAERVNDGQVAAQPPRFIGDINLFGNVPNTMAHVATQHQGYLVRDFGEQVINDWISVHGHEVFNAAEPPSEIINRGGGEFATLRGMRALKINPPLPPIEGP